jgi:Dyp-type peroxidase family
MPVSDSDLGKPIDWTDSKFWPLLGDLQGNILKGHGRDHTINSFLRFDGDIETVKAELRAIGAQVTSALLQMNETDAFRTLDRLGSSGVFFFLTSDGYRKLGRTIPDDAAFAVGMHDRSLDDPQSSDWEPHLRPGIDALLIVADDSVSRVGNFNAQVTAGFASAGITILGSDAGHALRSAPSANDPKGRGLEHFGYVDGRSQPLMLVQDVAKEQDELEGVDQWDPAFGPGEVVLVRDPNGLGPDSFGSYLVYRKLEQDVRGFKKREKELAVALGLSGDDIERAGAMVVGRFEDGTPLILSDKASDPNPTPNNFRYVDDPVGLKCPIHAHVRKINPRLKGTLAEEAEQRSHLMARRGIPFGDPDRDFDNEDSFPNHGVGLLFMAYNQSIPRQFEVTQQFWANDSGFPGDAESIDMIIGQGAGSRTPTWHPHYGAAGDEKADFTFKDFVSMRGGGYFFAPSIGFLKTLA